MISFSVCQSSSPSSSLKFRAGQSLAKFSLIIRDSFKIHKLKKLDSVSIGLSRHLSRALCACNWASMTYASCLWRKDRIRFPWIFCKTAAIGALSIEIQSKKIVIFFRRKPTRKKTEQNQTIKQGQSLEKVVVLSSASKTIVTKAMAYRPSREIKGDKERLSSVQQKSKIPVRRLTPLNNNSWKGSSSKEEADKKQRILMDSTEKPLENKPPSRIPIMVARTNSKTVWDKLPKGVMATKKRPLGRESGTVLVW